MIVNKRQDLLAIISSIKHWKEDYKKLKLFGGAKSFPEVFNGAVCSCCDFFRGCDLCPVVSKEGRNCNSRNSDWNGARRASECSHAYNTRTSTIHQKEFMRCRRNILRRLETGRKRLMEGKDLVNRR